LTIDEARESDRLEVEKLIAEYHKSEDIVPVEERIAWAVDEQLRHKSPGLLLVARDQERIVGVALAVYTPSAELGRVMTVNDFFVSADYRRRGTGRELAKHMIEHCRKTDIDEINLEVLSHNKTAAAFWTSLGFRQADRLLFKQPVDGYRHRSKPA